MPRPWQVILWREGDIRFGDSEGYKREETEGAADVAGRRGGDTRGLIRAARSSPISD